MKPTKKFVEWLQAHPAVWEALQPRFFEEGDWAFLDRKPRVVKQVDREARVLISSAWYGMENLKWLPSLSDLLGMIEETGWEWQRRSNHQWKVYKKGEPLNCMILDAELVGGDILAAAKLAVRVLEGKD